MTDSISIPGYRVTRKLGQGGMAAVYLAIQESFDREVALKVMAPGLNSDPTFATRFTREARIVAQIHHSSIVPVMDVGQHEGHHYLCMEYLPGGDLKERIVAGRHGVGLALHVCVAISSALDLAHRKGFVHRDIKPENILFREDGTPVLTDFGIARAIEPGTQLTMIGTMVGTPNYMSPEQVKGSELDGRSDLYSLGVVFYEMLTGYLPFTAESTMLLAIKHLNEPLPHLPPELAIYQPFLDQLMAKDREHRFATGNEVIRALRLITEMAAKREGAMVRPPPRTTTNSEPTLVSPTSPPLRTPVEAQPETVRIPSTMTQPSGIMQIPQYNSAHTPPPAVAPSEPSDPTLIHPGLPQPPAVAAEDPDATATRTKTKALPPPRPPAVRKPSVWQVQLRQKAVLALTMVKTAPLWALVTGIAVIAIGAGYLIGKIAGPSAPIPGIAEAKPTVQVPPVTLPTPQTVQPEVQPSGRTEQTEEPPVSDLPLEPSPEDSAEQQARDAREAERAAREKAAKELRAEIERKRREAEAKKREDILAQLAGAREDVARGRLWRSPNGDRGNALDRYNYVLFLDPKQLEAAAGLGRIATILEQETRNSVAVGDRNQAQWFIDQIRSIRTDHPSLPGLESLLANMSDSGLSKAEQVAMNKRLTAVKKGKDLLNRDQLSYGEVKDAVAALEAADAKPTPGVEELRALFPEAIARAAQLELMRGKTKNVTLLADIARAHNWMTPKLEDTERSLSP